MLGHGDFCLWSCAASGLFRLMPGTWQALPGQATNRGPRRPKNRMLGGLPGPGRLFKPPSKHAPIIDPCMY